MVSAGRVEKGGAPRGIQTQKKWGFEGWGEGWGPEGWGSKPRKSGCPKSGGPNPEKVGARRVEGPKFRAFFSWNFGGV